MIYAASKIGVSISIQNLTVRLMSMVPREIKASMWPAGILQMNQFLLLQGPDNVVFANGNIYYRYLFQAKLLNNSKGNVVTLNKEHQLRTPFC